MATKLASGSAVHANSQYDSTNAVPNFIWNFVESGSSAPGPIAHDTFIVKQYPGLGLGLKIGQTYTTRDLIRRCRSNFAKIKRLHAMLDDQDCVFFEPLVVGKAAGNTSLSTPVDMVSTEPMKSCCKDWTLVEAAASWEDFSYCNKVRVKHLPKLGLGLRIGQTYGISELIGRCGGNFAKIFSLELILCDVKQICFEPDNNSEQHLSLVSSAIPFDFCQIEEAEGLYNAGLVRTASGVFVATASKLLMQARLKSTDFASGPAFMLKILRYPLKSILATEVGQRQFAESGVRETAACLLAAWRERHFEGLTESPECFHVAMEAVREARGKITRDEFWRPVRLCLTTDLSFPRPDMGLLFYAMCHADQHVTCEFVPLDQRLELLAQELCMA